MSIWKQHWTPEQLVEGGRGTLLEWLDIQIVEIGADFLTMSMPVDHRTHQPLGVLHGGASAALAETVGSVAANLAVAPGYYCLGLDINANHLRSVRDGLVYATARPLHLGRTTQVWDIRISDAAASLVCISRLTMAVLKAESSG